MYVLYFCVLLGAVPLSSAAIAPSYRSSVPLSLPNATPFHGRPRPPLMRGNEDGGASGSVH